VDSYVWRVGLAKSGRNKVFKELTFIADSFFELAHIIASEVYESDMFSEDVTVMYMKRVKGLGKVVNFGDENENERREWSGNEPLEMAKNMPDERVMNFKCVCHEELRVADFNGNQIENLFLITDDFWREGNYTKSNLPTLEPFSS